MVEDFAKTLTLSYLW